MFNNSQMNNNNKKTLNQVTKAIFIILYSIIKILTLKGLSHGPTFKLFFIPFTLKKTFFILTFPGLLLMSCL